MTEPPSATPMPIECTIAFTELAALRAYATDAAAAQRDPQLLARAGLPGSGRIAQLRFGNEFCQRLLPSRAAVRQGLQLAAQHGFGFALGLPILTDAGLARAERLLAELPDGTEVAVNEWGLMRRMAHGFAHLQIIAGRQLCRLLKDPRVPPALGAGSQRGWANPGLAALLLRLHVRRLELDIPPFASLLEPGALGLGLSAHAPFGFVTTGRICRLGNLRQAPARRFAPEHGCSRECLTYCVRIARRSAHADSLPLLQRGNTIFYRHGDSCRGTLAAALAAGTIDRLVLPGDWHADRRADLLTG